MIRKYVEFEFDTSIIITPIGRFKQIGGVPMGGFVSAPLTVMDSNRREHKGRKLWTWVRGLPSWIVRYRDDICLLVSNVRIEEVMNETLPKLCKMYGPGIGIKLERIGQRDCFFVENRFLMERGI